MSTAGKLVGAGLIVGGVAAAIFFRSQIFSFFTNELDLLGKGLQSGFQGTSSTNQVSANTQVF